MPYIPTITPDSRIIQIANSLLGVLAQLTNPNNGLLVALPSGQILAKDAQVQKYVSAASEQLHNLLAMEDSAFQGVMEELRLNQIVSGNFQAATGAARNTYHYSIKLVRYQEQDFVCAELTGVGQPSTLIPVDGDSYHNIFESSVEPLFILDCSGNFIDLNQSALRMIHKSKEELLGASIYRNFGLNLFERVALRNQINLAITGTTQRFEWWLHEENNELLPVEISLQAGSFRDEPVVFGYVKNLYEVIDAEQDIRFRNHQLEFVNTLITNLSSSDSQHDVLNTTLDELIDKSDVTGGAVFTFSQDEGLLQLSYSAGEASPEGLPETQKLPAALVNSILKSEKRKAITDTRAFLKKALHKDLTVVPITTDTELLALILIWPGDEAHMTQSFAALLDFIGSAIGNYISRHRLLHQLTLSEDKYKLLFEASYDAIVLLQDGVVKECNEKALEFFRCTREDLINHSPVEFSPAFQPDGSRSDVKGEQIIQEVLSTGRPITFEWKHRRKDGTELDTEINANRLQIDGQYYVQGFMRDTTQRNQVQQAMRRQEILNESMAQFRNFLDKVNLIYFSLDVNGYITYANDYFLKYIEYSREELIGQDYFELLVTEHDREQRRAEYLATLQSRQLNTYYERDVISKTGQTKTIRWNSMFEYNADGELIGLTIVGKDMTDKRIAMEALKDNKIRLQDLFDNAHDLIQNISVDNKFIFVNRAWKERLGYTDEDIETLTLNDIVHPYYKAKLIYQLRNLYKGENVNKIETVFLTKAGKPVHLIGSITCSWQDGQPVATRGILHDITDRIKAERLQKVYYSIANLAISSKDLNSLYSAIHRELSKIIETRNIYIALCDDERRTLHFAYLVDQYVEKTGRAPKERPFTKGLSEYIIQSGKPLYMQKADLIKLAEEENLKIHGAIPEVMLCSPLAIGDRIIGVITLQDYQNPEAYVHTDIEILHFISNQVALAIERKRNEEQINTQNARLNAIFESGTHHMWSLNRHYELTSFNRNFAQSFEQGADHRLVPFTKIDSENMLPLHRNSYDFWKEKYELAFEGEPQHFEVHLLQPESWREVYLHPIYLDNGTFEEISGIALDITDKKKSQLALAENEEKFRHVFESFQDVYYRTTMDGEIELISPSVYNLLGYRETEVIGKNVKSFYANQEDFSELKRLVLEHESIRDYEVDMLGKNGTNINLLIDSRLAYDAEGNPIAMEGVARDVSELKRTQKELLAAKEEAENLLKVKTQFLANMSHELRTPMNGIIGMIDLLSQMNIDPEQSEYIDTLRKSSDALLAILNDILDLSKMQAGKLAVSENSVDLHETIGKIHSLFANRAQQKDLTFTYEISEQTPRYVVTDETRLLQILSNLTSNAIKFTNSGAVSITVESEWLRFDKYKILVRVKDSGIGISPENQALLFTDFTQLDNSSTKTFGGTGLGLAISKQLTHLLGGDIGVESLPGDGSVFWFYITVRKANEAEIKEHHSRQQLMDVEQKVLDYKPIVLLVDDNQINQKVAQKQLERLGCEIDVASNGYEAIDYATSRSYDIIFMDIQMPQMDGVTATKHIKEKLGSNCPPIVAMTAYSMKDDAEKFMNQGMDDYVSKPVKSADLYATISKWKETPKVADTEAIEEGGTAADLPIIDSQVVEQLKQIGGEDFTKQLYTEFEQEAAELLEEAKKELQAQQYKSILSTLHQLKGTGFTLGINPLAELAKQLEHEIKHDKFDTVDDMFAELLVQYENYRKAYKEIII
ncbi:PAS domain S-box protein [Pontibacter cellulosilyticus]|uniref:histidine kinase n=1 Tax=Pontibacter cellulosilyticus TaxID=1720253 RepID=A0A923SI97_9BACT|nr:PAS domain S-box protein [Pontibacter cellulosilyticus]MBC5992574.1 PAS domain S-box protein [Pontibacter cellulosilyticus]